MTVSLPLEVTVVDVDAVDEADDVGVVGAVLLSLIFSHENERIKKTPQQQMTIPPTIRPNSIVRGIRQSPATCRNKRKKYLTYSINRHTNIARTQNTFKKSSFKVCCQTIMQLVKSATLIRTIFEK